MPELPEVETVRRGLEKLIVERCVESVTCIDSPKSFPNVPSEVKRFLVGAKVIAVRRRAKVLMIDLSSGYTLVTHLKMTGQLVFVGEQRFGAGHPNDSLVARLPDKSTRVALVFLGESHLYFNDLRKFGWMKLLPTAEVANLAFMQKVGPEPLENSFTGDVLYERLQRRKNTTIKAALLDQTVLAGVGNIYADESLWAVKLHPATLVKNVPKASVKKLAIAIKAVMNLSIEKGGSTDKNYVNAEGKKGSYLSFANVFRREGQPCPRCGSTINKIRVASRGTHICYSCQIIDK
ncbi:bifunctional DNA-formamidopyrimidine glycosylase/DNA-(apurinic or apyrimidinic site) lyase [Candidatus Saccharibacteria bacterium]|nr:MAG: bifunctional DNA-formamidopyrimidine glycosylase/DNA-(apurinic or apyrimidinic site) lyase [Candidatus Saccharibacteria bacterium]